MSTEATEPVKHRRVVGRERDRMQSQIVKAYKKGASIRALAAEHNRSYGAIHRMLVEAGVPLRNRGGANGGERTKT